MSDPLDLGPLAADLGAAAAAALRPHLEPVAWSDGEALLRDGEPSGWLTFVVDGRLAVIYDPPGGERVDLAERGPGSWLGEVGVLDGGPATATVVARGPGRGLRLHSSALARLTHDEPRAVSALLRHLSREMAHRIADGSSGVLEPLGPDLVRVRPPAEAPAGWFERLFGAWLGGRR